MRDVLILVSRHLIFGAWTMRSFFLPSGLKFCESMNVATVFSFLYISRFLKLKENVPLFLTYMYRECVFSLKAYFGGVMNLNSLRNF